MYEPARAEMAAIHCDSSVIFDRGPVGGCGPITTSDLSRLFEPQERRVFVCHGLDLGDVATCRQLYIGDQPEFPQLMDAVDKATRLNQQFTAAAKRAMGEMLTYWCRLSWTRISKSISNRWPA